MKRPRGIEISAILIFLFAGFSLLGILTALIIMSINPEYNIVKAAAFGSLSSIIWFIVWPVILALLIIAGVGLIKYKEWARKLTVYTSFAGIAALIWGIIRVGRVSIGIIALALFVWLILYFNKREIVKLFK